MTEGTVHFQMPKSVSYSKSQTQLLRTHSFYCRASLSPLLQHCQRFYEGFPSIHQNPDSRSSAEITLANLNGEANTNTFRICFNLFDCQEVATIYGKHAHVWLTLFPLIACG